MIFIISFFVNQRLSNEIIKNSSYINNSEAIIRNSNVMHKEMIEMQSGFRGFLLTGQEVFLQPYYDGINTVPPIIREQYELLSSDLQKQRLDSIALLHARWVSYANSLIATKLDTLPEATEKYKELFEKKLRMEVGKKLNDRIQKIFLYFDNYEYQVRKDRRETLKASLKSTGIITFALTLVSVIIALIAGFYFIRTITSRISKMVDLAEHISKGDFKKIEDTKQDELNRLSVSLNDMSETLEKNFKELTKKNSELDQFAYVVSHDLKAPLRGIGNIISWIEEDHEQDLTPDIIRNLALIKGRATRLENMINGLLEYAKVGKIKKGYEAVDVTKLVLETVELLVPKHFNVELAGIMPVLVTERLHIEQVFSNLISNAVKYNHNPKPVIGISAKELPDAYEFRVSDNGQGIQKEYFDRIFVIFQTLQERDAFESTGVGLAIVKKIIEDYKGTITVTSEPGTGTSFVFTWPKTNNRSIHKNENKHHFIS
jgi:signal transduction histidine kinase